MSFTNSYTASTEGYVRAMERLVTVVQELSLAKDLEGIMRTVRRAARELTGADGASFVLHERGMCYYADEDAIAPLWKGKRFPSKICVSGWVMQNRQPVAIEDIFDDPRVPMEAYRATFVKSLLMVPIRSSNPIGAIGVYWGYHHLPNAEETRLLSALADSTSVAMENVQLYSELERKVEDRTASLQALNSELEAFSYSVSHDLRAPLRHIDGFVQLLRDEAGPVLEQSHLRHLAVIADAARRMSLLIDDLLRFSRMGRAELMVTRFSMNELVREVQAELAPDAVGRNVRWTVADLPEVTGDRALLKQVWINLLSNALKYSRTREVAEVEISCAKRDHEVEFQVRDNGVGFDMEFAGKLFGVFERLHSDAAFEGTGIGLANVRRIIHRHSGRTWAESQLDRGASFFFTLASS